ncbi:hypothetical protein QR680_012520 [Steinernema hermaphroditum]|uniref:Uncharacterized protein n=1 Tax=Steinernema hermaphroditum TaxID=289476 RepID=A0AA39I3K9_9BILA|nr:hypothetical protein QR680_012520 [Steinernema hermaphroditum]
MSWFKKLLSFPSKNEQSPEQKPAAGSAAPPTQQDAVGAEMPAPTCQIEVKSKFPFMRNEKMEVATDADGKPVFTQSQLQQTMQKLKERKKARKKIQEEEQQYVEYRRQDVLARNRAFSIKHSVDEPFPKRRTAVGFGDRKAYFMQVRPNPKYAVWMGTSKTARKAKAIQPTQTTVDTMTDHSAMPAEQSKREQASQKEPRPGACTEDGHTEEQSHTGKGSLQDPSRSDKDKLKKKEIPTKKVPKKENALPKGNNAANPIVDGIPFWMHANSEQDELTDDDLPIDSELVDRVCNREMALPHAPFKKRSFNPFSAVQIMKKDDCLFVRDTVIFKNTVEAVIALQPERNSEKTKKGHVYLPPQPPRQITWNGTLTVTTFDPKDRLPKEKRTPFTEALKDLRREKKVK